MRLKQESKKEIPLNIATWNIHTLIDWNDTDRPHRHTALIAYKLAWYKINIVALNETQLANKGEPNEKSSGYSFFWSRHAPNDKHEAGVGYAIKTSLVGKLACPLKGVNDCFMTMRLPLHHGKKFATIISAYAPTMTNADETKDKFYEDFMLSLLFPLQTSSSFLVILMPESDKTSPPGKGVLGKHGTRKCNSNCLLFLQTCTKHNLLITNTIFYLPAHNKISWMHPYSKHWHLIDYVIVR